MRKLALLMLLQLGPGKPVVKEPAKTGMSYPVPANCGTLTVRTKSWIVSSSDSTGSITSVNEPIEIICEPKY